MTNEELCKVYGGLSLTTSLLNTIARFISTSLELGRSLGTSIRRAIDKKKCSYN